MTSRRRQKTLLSLGSSDCAPWHPRELWIFLHIPFPTITLVNMPKRESHRKYDSFLEIEKTNIQMLFGGGKETEWGQGVTTVLFLNQPINKLINFLHSCWMKWRYWTRPSLSFLPVPLFCGFYYSVYSYKVLLFVIILEFWIPRILKPENHLELT